MRPSTDGDSLQAASEAFGMGHGGFGIPSRWLVRWAHLIRPSGTVLDVACGAGRHLRWLVTQGHEVTGVDRDEQALAPLRALGRVVVADIEGGPWPLTGQTFDAVLVTNYLWRPLMPSLLDSVGPQGVLIYETFAQGQQTVGRPSRSDFLLNRGELLQTCADMNVIAYEDGFLTEPDRFVQRIVAVRKAESLSAAPARHALSPLPAR